jgi:hypothetical protein
MSVTPETRSLVARSVAITLELTEAEGHFCNGS